MSLAGRPEPAQSKYAADLLRAESIGLQSGCIPFALASITNTTSDEEKALAKAIDKATL